MRLAEFVFAVEAAARNAGECLAVLGIGVLLGHVALIAGHHEGLGLLGGAGGHI